MGRCSLLLNGLPEDRYGCPATRSNEVGRQPQHTLPVAFLDARAFLAEQAAGHTLRLFPRFTTATFGGYSPNRCPCSSSPSIATQLRLEVGTDLGKEGWQPIHSVAIDHATTMFGYKDPLDMPLEKAVLSRLNIVLVAQSLIEPQGRSAAGTGQGSAGWVGLCLSAGGISGTPLRGSKPVSQGGGQSSHSEARSPIPVRSSGIATALPMRGFWRVAWISRCTTSHTPHACK